MTQVTCGAGGIEKAVVVPRVLFPLILERLSEFPKSKNYKSPFLSTWGGKWVLHSFLARRCSKEFLQMYIKANLGCLDQIVKSGLMLSAMAEVGLVVTLNNLGMLPEEYRRQFVETVSQYAVDGDDLTGHEQQVHPDGFQGREIRGAEGTGTLKTAEVRENVELNHQVDEPPEEHMSALMESFGTLTLHFGEEPDAAGISTVRGGTRTNGSASIHPTSRSASRAHSATSRNRGSLGAVGPDPTSSSAAGHVSDAVRQPNDKVPKRKQYSLFIKSSSRLPAMSDEGAVPDDVLGWFVRRMDPYVHAIDRVIATTAGCGSENSWRSNGATSIRASRR